MKKFSKKSMLGLLTASAIVVTTVGSFAAWDALTTTSTSNLTVRKPTVVSTAAISFTEADNAEKMPVSTGTVTFSVKGLPENSDSTKLTISDPVVKQGNNDVTTNFDVTITGQGDDTLTPVAGSATSEDTTVGASNTYTVTVTPKDEEAAKTLVETNNQFTVEVGATLTK